MQVSPATRLFTYLRDFTPVRPVDVSATSRAPAAKETDGASAAAPATPADASTPAAAAARRAAPARQTVSPPPSAMPRLLPRGSLVNIIT